MVMRNPPANYQDWQQSVSKIIRNGPLWPMDFYKKALFLYDLCWYDCDGWLNDVRGKAIVNQIICNCGSISANIEEGYGRGFGRDYARFLSIAVASARETQGWYLRSRHLASQEALDHRLKLCDEIIAALVKNNRLPKASIEEVVSVNIRASGCGETDLISPPASRPSPRLLKGSTHA